MTVLDRLLNRYRRHCVLAVPVYRDARCELAACQVLLQDWALPGLFELLKLPAPFLYCPVKHKSGLNHSLPSA